MAAQMIAVYGRLDRFWPLPSGGLFVTWRTGPSEHPAHLPAGALDSSGLIRRGSIPLAHKPSPCCAGGVENCFLKRI